ncbi:MAG: hypothetical protein J1E62_01535 [Lachnospiraceae bacterium]|nr:hypothetical protein [Lachnospiraceae bacterium]
MKIKHYFSFDKKHYKKNGFKKLSSANWDILRTENAPGAFSIEKEISAFEENCKTSVSYKETAEIICNFIKKHELGNRLVSLGCGKGIVEYHIKQIMPEVHIKCTDYAKKSIEQLAKVFIDCDEFDTFDMLSGDYGTWGGTGDILLMYRISTEFSTEQWQLIFDKIYNANIQYVIFVPTEIMTLRIALKEKAMLLHNILSGNKITFCGWMYSYKEYLKFFGYNNNTKDSSQKYQVITFDKYRDTGIFVLQRTPLKR